MNPAEMQQAIERAQRWLANGWHPVPILAHDINKDAPQPWNGKTWKRPPTPGKQPWGALWTSQERMIWKATPATLAADWPGTSGFAFHPGLGVVCGGPPDATSPDNSRGGDSSSRNPLGSGS